MAITQTSMSKRSFDAPDETRPAGAGQAQIVHIGDLALMRVTVPPGWRWSTDVRPLVNTESCQTPHLLYMFSGRLHVVMQDGSEEEFGRGDLAIIPPGHDAWVTGDEPAVSLDITGGGIWAKPR